MILNELISRYLDGELTPEEDSMLRETLAGDSEAKEAFDIAVLLHVHMQCDTYPVVPIALELKTIDAVYSEMDSDERFQSKVQRTRSFAQKSVRGYGKRAAVAVAMLLLFVLPVHDYWLQSGITTDTAQGSTVKGTQEVAARVQRNTVKSTHSSIPAANNIVLGSVPNETEPTVALETLSQNAQTAEEVVPNAPSTLRSLFASGSIGYTTESAKQKYTTTLEGTQAPSAPVISSATPNEAASTVDSYSAPVSVDATYSSGLGTNMASISNVQQLTQSTGFVIDESMIVGVEVGLTTYSMAYDGKAVSNVPNGSSRNPLAGGRGQMVSSIEVMQQNPIEYTKLIVTQGPTGRVATTSYSGVSDQQMLWGSAFIQATLLEVSNVQVQGRAGAGVGQDGALAYSRLHAEYSLFDGVSLNVGAEFRGMPFRYSTKDGQATALQLGFSYAALTGLRIKL